MNYFLLAAATFFSISAWAQASTEVINLIEKTYNPAIESTSKDITTFVDLCHRTEIELIAQDPVSLKPGKVKFTQFIRKFSFGDPGDLKTVIVMPPTGGVNVLDWSYAARLCLNDFRVVVLTNWDFDTLNELDMNMHDRGALRALAAIRHTVEFLSPRRPNQIGILGTSVGAISSVLAIGYESRISAGALIVGGVGMPEIIANSTESHLTKLRNDRMAAYKFADVQSYQQALAAHVKIDPKDFINYSGPKNIWMMVATKDDTVPTKNQWELFKAYGKPASLMYPDNHLETIKHTAFADTGTIIEYFKSVLK